MRVSSVRAWSSAVAAGSQGYRGCAVRIGGGCILRPLFVSSALSVAAQNRNGGARNARNVWPCIRARCA